MTPVSRFSLVPVPGPPEWRDVGHGRTPWLDVAADGHPLQARAHGRGHVGVLGWGFNEAHRIQQLLGRMPSRLPTGRVPLYVCTCCGDEDCGTVVARIEIGPDTVVWSDFTLEVTW